METIKADTCVRLRVKDSKSERLREPERERGQEGERHKFTNYSKHFSYSVQYFKKAYCFTHK